MNIWKLLFGKKEKSGVLQQTQRSNKETVVDDFQGFRREKIFTSETSSEQEKANASPKIVFVSINKCNMSLAVAEQLKNQFIAFDIETTGLSQYTDRIVELGAVEFINGKANRRYSTLVNPGIRISEEATRVNNITNDMVKGERGEEECLHEFADFLGEAMNGEILMCAHNASFDFGFLEKAFLRCSIDCQIEYVDTLQFCRQAIPGLKNYKQESLEKHFGISDKEAHRAEIDAENCGLILLKALSEGTHLFQNELEFYSSKTPNLDELETCAVIKNILDNAGKNTKWLRFTKNYSSGVNCTCYYDFLTFKYASKGHYIVLPAKQVDQGDYVWESCSESEGGIKNKRVYFQNPLELLRFETYINDAFDEQYNRMIESVFYTQRYKREAEIYMDHYYQLSASDQNTIMNEVYNKDYSGIPLPEAEKKIHRNDVLIGVSLDLIPLSQITIKDYNWGDAVFSTWIRANELRKEGNLLEALALYSDCRAKGMITPSLYIGFAQAYHSLHDYEREILILDEAIDYFGEEATYLDTRREKAIKTLYKQQESKRAQLLKAEEKRINAEKREAAKQEKKRLTEEKKHVGRAIVQMDDNDNVIAEYLSISEAVSIVGVSSKSIRDAAKGVQKHAAGFRWKYKDEID